MAGNPGRRHTEAQRQTYLTDRTGSAGFLMRNPLRTTNAPEVELWEVPLERGARF